MLIFLNFSKIKRFLNMYFHTCDPSENFGDHNIQNASAPSYRQIIQVVTVFLWGRIICFSYI